MKSFTVTASNKYFWQTLTVLAPDVDAACVAFRAYLAEPAQQREEEYEQTEGEKLAPDERCPRENYVYAFDDDDVVERDDEASETVSMIASGGNG